MERPEELRISRVDMRVLAAQHRETQAHMSLLQFLRFVAPFPSTDTFASASDLLLYLANTIVAEKPRLIVECGSGVSTLVMARTVQLMSLSTRIVALEHDPKYVRKSNRLLEIHDLVAFAEIRHAPLRPVSLAGHETEWYDPDRLDGLTAIGLLLVDGPPTATGPSARYPAIPLLHQQLAQDSIVLLDDTARSDEADVARRWADEELSGFERSEVRFARGLTEFRRPRRNDRSKYE
jgi:hypothetical protein